ncbi:MAG: Phosphate-selective porin [Verrucomicrobiaceae bacterium]|nr:Phosphate-selective porin [Verrucomicrobiaceae bacterium]
MNSARFPKTASFSLAALCLIFSVAAQAGTAPFSSGKNVDTTIAPEQPSLFDKIWAVPVLYKNNENPVIEEFDLTGRFQLDYFNIDSNKGDNDFTEIRRFRLGVDTYWADRFIQVKATVDTALRNFNADEVFYNRMTDLFIQFHFNDAFNLRVGKFEPHFGYDREFSDNTQKFFERSVFDDQVFNNTGNDYVTGAAVSGKIGNWGYQAAIFSDQVDKEFGQFNGGQSYLAEISYDFSKALQSDKALWVLDYMHMDNNAKSNVFNTMQNAAATYFDYQKGKFGLVSQLGYGNGIDSKGDIYEFMIMPTYLITKQLEFVVRYQLGLASQDNGITTLNRQEKTIGKFTGDAYNAGYVGLNYYLYGQKLKLMVGEQFAELRGGTGANAGYQGWTTLAGLRLFF